MPDTARQHDKYDLMCHDTGVTAPIDHDDLLRLHLHSLETLAMNHLGDEAEIVVKMNSKASDARFILVIPTGLTVGGNEVKFAALKAAIQEFSVGKAP